jgi:hypothetical protein
MTKFELPEMSPRIFRPAPMVELEVGAAGAAGAGADMGEAVIGAAAIAGETVVDGAVGAFVAAGTGVSGVLTDEIAV